MLVLLLVSRFGQLDEVAVRVANVHRVERPLRAGAFDGPELDGNAHRRERGDDVRQRPVDKEADVGAARRRPVRVRRDLRASRCRLSF
jgi:hypothetical protein